MSEEVQKKRQLTTRQRRAIDAFLTGATVGQAAGAAGVTTKTVKRWRDKPHFEEALRKHSQQATSDASRRLTGSMDMAVEVLVELAEDVTDSVPHSVRLHAARYILDAAIRLQELTDVMARIEALERHLASKGMT